jgi:hypothetical protein
MRKREIEALNKKEFYKKFIKENNLNLTLHSFANSIRNHILVNIIYTKGLYTKDGIFYYSGLIDLSSKDYFISKKHTKIYLKCQNCNKLYKTKQKHKTKKNLDYNLFVCQKCAVQLVNKRKDKRLKNSITLKNSYKNGEKEHLRKLYKTNLIKYNKVELRELQLNKTKYEKENIKNKKIDTWFKCPIKERKNINKKRTVKFREYNKFRYEQSLKILQSMSVNDLIRYRNYTLKYKFCDSKWNEKRIKILKKSNFKCSCCNEKKALDVHHLIPFKFTLKHIYLIAVCRSCHMKLEREFEKVYLLTKDVKLAKNSCKEKINEIKYQTSFRNS